MNKMNPLLPAITIGFCGGMALYYTNKNKPKFKMMIVESYSSTAYINIQHTKYPHIKHIITNNTDCLKDKGYDVNLKIPDVYRWDMTYSIGNIKKDNRTKQRFIADCKECQVNTVIIYEYNDIIFGNKNKLAKEQLYWHKNFKG